MNSSSAQCKGMAVDENMSRAEVRDTYVHSTSGFSLAYSMLELALSPASTYPGKLLSLLTSYSARA